MSKFENYSVLMSVYEKEKPSHLRDSIESILSQTKKTNDFVIVCDGPLNKKLDSILLEALTNHKKQLEYFDSIKI